MHTGRWFRNTRKIKWWYITRWRPGHLLLKIGPFSSLRWYFGGSYQRSFIGQTGKFDVKAFYTLIYFQIRLLFMLYGSLKSIFYVGYLLELWIWFTLVSIHFSFTLVSIKLLNCEISFFTRLVCDPSGDWIWELLNLACVSSQHQFMCFYDVPQLWYC